MGVVGQLGGDAAGEAEDWGVCVEKDGEQQQREEAGDCEVLVRVAAEDLEGVELLADLAGAEVGGDRRAGDAGDRQVRLPCMNRATTISA